MQEVQPSRDVLIRLVRRETGNDGKRREGRGGGENLRDGELDV